MGGAGLFQSTETFPSACQNNNTSSSSSSFSFNLTSEDIFDACAITLPDQSSVYLTGGEKRLKTVEIYDASGLVGTGPDLNVGRRGHGCTSYQHRGHTVSFNYV